MEHVPSQEACAVSWLWQAGMHSGSSRREVPLNALLRWPPDAGGVEGRECGAPARIGAWLPRHLRGRAAPCTRVEAAAS